MRKRIYRLYTWLVYAILWGMVWTYPVLVEVMTAMQNGTTFVWTGILHAWTGIATFFLLFLLHRLPMYRLLLRHRIRSYCLSVLLLLTLFAACRYACIDEPPGHHPQKERPVPASVNRQPPERKAFIPDGNEPPARPKKGAEESGIRPPQPERPRPSFFGIPGMLTIDFIIALLMLGFDVAIILLSRSQEEEEKKRRLDAAHKAHELEHLKAQLNPHFFMNMLNNIHGMVEMDARLAQEMIMELSGLMRYVLYEGAKPYTTLQHEKEFIGNYVELMRKRCSDTKVCIGLYLPEEPLEQVRIPPLLFISIVENAFKHGISYRSPSFVEIYMNHSDRHVTFECRNSVHPQQPRQDHAEGGIGLANLRQRLQLLYGKAFSLEINPTESVYHVILTIPCEYESDTLPGH